MSFVVYGLLSTATVSKLTESGLNRTCTATVRSVGERFFRCQLERISAYAVFTVVLLKIAVMSQHLRRVVVVAASVLGVREAMAVVWSLAAVVPGEASVRFSIVQKTSVGAAVVVLVYRPWRQAVDVSAAVEVLVCFPLPVFVVLRCGR